MYVDISVYLIAQDAQLNIGFQKLEVKEKNLVKVRGLLWVTKLQTMFSCYCKIIVRADTVIKKDRGITIDGMG